MTAGRNARVLAGDIGGTKTNLALYAVGEGRDLELLREKSFPSRDFGGLEEVVQAFCADGKETIAAAAFGIAGPVIDGEVTTTNLPWHVEAPKLSKVIGGARVRLMNDLETTAYGALFLPKDEIHVLHAGTPRRGNAAVIAAGTGLGQAILFWDGSRHHPSATEGGHADFAPRGDLECDLLRFLLKEYRRVSYERVLSGPGIHNVFRFFTEALKKPVAAEVRKKLDAGEDPGAVVGAAGVDGSCATCSEVVDLFLSLYGAQAGNLALTTLAVGGVYVGGGIVTKLLPRIAKSAFLRSFRDKGRYEKMMAEIPVRIILNPKTSLFGAAEAACDLV